jgi:hypothetical protein
MDVQKTMEFILEQQAVTAARMERVSAEIVKLKETSEIHARELEVHTDWKLDMSQPSKTSPRIRRKHLPFWRTSRRPPRTT